MVAEDIRDYIRKPIESFTADGEIIYVVYSYDNSGVDIWKAFRREEDAIMYQKYHTLNSYLKSHIEKIILE